ncbi:MAG: hypothetical protein ACE5I1_29075 [bacterium]
MPFLTEPEDIDLFVCIPVDETNDDFIPANEQDFRNMQKVCADNNSILAQVLDAEGEYVCLAPLPIAQKIIKLLNAEAK